MKTGVLLFLGEPDCDGGTLTGDAVQRNLCVVNQGCMLDDGESQPGTAYGFGMALVHPVEPLKNPRLMLRWDADAGIRNSQHHLGIFFLNGYGDPAAGTVILDGIAAKIGHNGTELGGVTADVSSRVTEASSAWGWIRFTAS